MKKLILFLIALTVCGTNFAQINVTNSSFPAAGDTLHVTLVQAPPSSLSLGNGGANQTWNFSALNVGFVRKSVIRPASEGQNAADFPTANLYTSVAGGTAEEYLKSSATKYEYLGYAGADPLGIGINVKARYNPTEIQRTATLKYKDKHSYNSAFLVPFGKEIVPDTILSTLPIQPDSFRLKFASLRKDTVDAWGAMTIPGGTFQVLRERRITYNDTKLEAKVPFLGWIDVTSFVSGIGGGFLGKDTTAQFYFWNNVAKEPIANVSVNKDTLSQIQSVTFKVVNTMTGVAQIEVNNSDFDMTISPNPIHNFVLIDLSIPVTGKHFLTIYNLVGQKIWQKEYNLATEKERFSENLEMLKTGNYFIRLSDAKGKSLITKQLHKE